MERTIGELQEAMRNGEETAISLVRYYLTRIETIDERGPTINAVLTINPDAEAIAASLDEERSNGQLRGPLHGIPLLIKANIDTADRMTTTAGSLALAGHLAQKDAFLVAQLRRAGAVILGKSNLSEWANFRSRWSTSGWSSEGGLTRNPHVLDRNPSGSSSGSAAAVAADLCAAAVGTETDGSIVSPSNACGVVGIKPTRGLISRSGIIPISESQDTAGPMARTVADAAILLGAMIGADGADEATSPLSERSPVDFSAALDRASLSGARIGVARNYFGSSPQVDAIMENCLDVMRSAGAIIVDDANIETSSELRAPEIEVLLYEFKAGLNDYLATSRSSTGVRCLADVIAYNEEHHRKIMPYFGQDRLITAQKMGPLTDRNYREALREARRLAGPEGLDTVFEREDLQAIVAPTGTPAHVTDLINGDHHGGSSSSPAAVSGYPSISVPAGAVLGLPVNITFMGRAWQETSLIGLAYAFEQATLARRSPRFLSTADLSGA